LGQAGGGTLGDWASYCPSDMKLCGQGYLKDPINAVPSPNELLVYPFPEPEPQGRSLEDDVVQDEEVDGYVNARLRLSFPMPTSEHPPAASQLVDALAQRADVPSSYVLTDLAMLGVATPSPAAQQAVAVAHLHVTVYARNRKQVDAITEALRGVSDIQAASANFTVDAVDIFSLTAHPLVCALSLLRHRPTSHDLLLNLVELPTKEVELVQAALSSRAQNQTTCSPNAQNVLASRLGFNLSSPL